MAPTFSKGVNVYFTCCIIHLVFATQSNFNLDSNSTSADFHDLHLELYILSMRRLPFA